MVSQQSEHLVLGKCSIRFYPHGYREILTNVFLIQLQAVVAQTYRFAAEACLVFHVAAVSAQAGNDC